MSGPARSALTERSPAWKSDRVVIGLVSAGIYTGIGWLIGVILLWTSKPWTRRDRLIGTFIPILGILLAYLCLPLWTAEETCRYQANGAQVCTGGPSERGEALFIAALVLPPLVTGVLLARRLRNPADGNPGAAGSLP